VEKFGDLKKPEPVIGTGPWMLDAYRPNVSLTLVRNPAYFVGRLAYIDRVEMFVRRGQCLAPRRLSPAASTIWAGSFPAPSTARTGCSSWSR
jgi:ABC-type transport system substrate-binding protein